MRRCKSCKEESVRIITGLCDKCYQRKRRSPKINPLPRKGEIAYTEEGKPICHICGKGYDKLMSHVYQTHDMTARDYKIEFGLDLNQGIMSEESKEKARKTVEDNYENIVLDNLLTKGAETRFKKGHSRTKGKFVSEQSKKRMLKNLNANRRDKK